MLTTELSAMLPVANLVGLKRAGESLRLNALAALVITLVAWGLTDATGSVAQWIALGAGAYVTFSWAQSLSVTLSLIRQ
ncbi:MAG: hypothetical protein QGI55_08820 [Pseudomonadales bacterium]|nr:hypothetical protein [Pseudomonadales bacterium]